MICYIPRVYRYPYSHTNRMIKNHGPGGAPVQEHRLVSTNSHAQGMVPRTKISGQYVLAGNGCRSNPVCVVGKRRSEAQHGRCVVDCIHNVPWSPLRSMAVKYNMGALALFMLETRRQARHWQLRRQPEPPPVGGYMRVNDKRSVDTRGKRRHLTHRGRCSSAREAACSQSSRP